MMDATSKKCIQISVSADGGAKIAFLEDKGHAVRTIRDETTRSSPGSRPAAPSDH